MCAWLIREFVVYSAACTNDYSLTFTQLNCHILINLTSNKYTFRIYSSFKRSMSIFQNICTCGLVNLEDDDLKTHFCEMTIIKIFSLKNKNAHITWEFYIQSCYTRFKILMHNTVLAVLPNYPENKCCDYGVLNTSQGCGCS